MVNIMTQFDENLLHLSLEGIKFREELYNQSEVLKISKSYYSSLKCCLLSFKILFTNSPYIDMELHQREKKNFNFLEEINAFENLIMNQLIIKLISKM